MPLRRGDVGDNNQLGHKISWKLPHIYEHFSSTFVLYSELGWAKPSGERGVLYCGHLELERIPTGGAKLNRGNRRGVRVRRVIFWPSCGGRLALSYDCKPTSVFHRGAFDVCAFF